MHFHFLILKIWKNGSKKAKLKIKSFKKTFLKKGFKRWTKLKNALKLIYESHF